MLKLPKGLKKKKKGKKSKKDQELFTEEELQQYKREHQQSEQQVAEKEPQNEKSEADDEWSKFAALTTGVDSILKKTQGDLDRIKSTSFFKRVAPPSQTKVEPKEEKVLVEPPKKEEDLAKQLLNAVVELSESEEESECDDSAFDTTYIDKVETGELPLAYIPDSPEEETDLGPDPFDTGYAEKVIKGPAVSTRGKKLVNIGAAVEVLTGKVEVVGSTSKTRRQRRGIQNLLLESFEAKSEDSESIPAAASEPIVTKTLLLDEPTDLGEEVPIDLSVSLHLSLLQQKKEENSNNLDQQSDDVNDLKALDSIIYSRSKTPEPPLEVASDWSEFEVKKDKEDKKPKRPPLPSRPPQPSNLQILLGEEENDDDDDLNEDPFDTTYVEKVVPKSIEYDDDFDPRAVEELEKAAEAENSNLSVIKKDLLHTSHTDLAQVIPTLEPSANSQSDVEIDPFDTSAVDALVVPCKTELKYLEKELLESNQQACLSDDDFDPRADEEVKPDLDQLRQRKSSLSLQIPSANHKLVSFAVTTPDLLKADAEGSGKIPKPLTPYYTREISLDDTVEEDPFDTSFVPANAPTSIELQLIEKEILKETTLKHSISDPDFDPRAITPVPEKPQTDLFLESESHDTKVLTPYKDNSSTPEEAEIDPFDTSIAVNILPGSAELKLLEDELIDKKPEPAPPTDILSDTQDNSIYVKILTPQPSGSLDLESQEDYDPFDTSFAANLAPGETEIKIIESELIN